MRRSFVFLMMGCALLVSLLSGGCTTVYKEPALAQTTLMVARSGDTAHLAWDTKPGVLYTVMFANSRKASSTWAPLPQATRLRGTGGKIEITDQIPYNRQRVYRIHAELNSSR